MENVTGTPIIDVVPKALTAIILSQRVLAKYLIPDSGISADDCINELLGILDDKELVEQLNRITK